MLHQRAAESDIDHLAPTADAKNRPPGRSKAENQIDLRLIEFLIRFPTKRRDFLAIEPGMHIPSARNQQGIKTIYRKPGFQQNRFHTGKAQRLHIILRIGHFS